MTCIILVVAVTVFTIPERLTASCFKSLFTFSFLKALEAYLLFLNKKKKQMKIVLLKQSLLNLRHKRATT